MLCRGVRGAITVSDNAADVILAETRRLLERMVAENDIVIEDIACYTGTPTAHRHKSITSIWVIPNA